MWKCEYFGCNEYDLGPLNRTLLQGKDCLLWVLHSEPCQGFFRALACLTMLRFARLWSAIHEKTFHITHLTNQLNYYCPNMPGEAEYDEDENVSQPDLCVTKNKIQPRRNTGLRYYTPG